ncbi:MAG: SRPBCC family protein [Rubrobacteraceae bacterium]
MTTIAKNVRIGAPKERVWKLLADLGGVVNYHPFVTNSYYETEQESGAGASRVCEFGPDSAVQERAIEWKEGKSYTLAIDFTKGRKPPIQNQRARVSVREAGGGTLAAIEMSYEPKFGPAGALMDRFVMRPRFEKLLSGVMAGLKHHAETGEPIDRGFLERAGVTPSAA